jgi:hypothetical protein
VVVLPQLLEVDMLFGLSIGDLSALLMVLLTAVATVAYVLLWITTKQTLALLVEQVRHQVTSTYSQTQQAIVNAHREIFFGILNNPTLLENFAKANNLDSQAWQMEKFAAFLLNQVLMGYINFANGIISTTHFEGFKRDARDLFSYKSIRNHWQNVRHVHSEDFRQFVETELLWSPVGAE